MLNLTQLTNIQKRAYLLSSLSLVAMILGSLALDQISKKVAEDELKVWASKTSLKEYQGKRWPVWSTGNPTSALEKPEFYLSFNFNYVRNQGAAWGFLSDLDDKYRIPFFYIVTLLAVLVIFSYLKNTPLSYRLARFSLALVLSGALGNFLDRLFRGYVVDFLDVRWVFPLPWKGPIRIDFFPSFLDFFNFHSEHPAFRYNFPNFNWADSAITVGVALLIFDMVYLETLRNKAAKKHEN